MSMEFQLPNIGEGVDSADIAELLVAEGDTIEAEQVVMELETDKAVVELPCPHAGTIQKLMVSEGDTIAVGQTLFSIETTNGQGTKSVDSSPRTAESTDAVAETTDARGAEEEQSAVERSGSASSKQKPPQHEPAAAQPDESAESDQKAQQQEQSGPIDFELPNIGEGVDSADVAEIHVAEGDEIEADQIVMELETDKAVVELPCPHAGTIAALHVSAGDTIEVGQKLLTIEGVRGKGKSPAPQKTRPEQQAVKPSKEPASKDKSSQDKSSKDKSSKDKSSKEKADPPAGPPAAKTGASATAADAKQQAVAVARQTEIVTGEDNGQPPVPAAPSTRRLARQLGVNLRQVEGSGPGGRITQEDVQQFVKRRLTGGLPATTGSEMAFAGGALAPPPLPDFSKYGPIEREKLNKLGRTAAENLTLSWNVIPHVTQHDRADVTELETARKKFTKGAGASGPKVTMTAIVMKALATALQQNPRFNSSLDPQTMEIVYKQYYHIGCAVDTPGGLLVPVVRDVDAKSIRQVAAEISQLAELARDRKLPVEAMQGATCTVTNLGGIGGVAFTPIVNYPEVCILGLARGQKELQLDENGELTERMMLPLSLSYDHRVINGADAARFLVSLCQMLSDPFQLLSAI
jgi:pyruvate dehydrogenase E2 component (dihydrolipoamide acetyltransferase)